MATLHNFRRMAASVATLIDPARGDAALEATTFIRHTHRNEFLARNHSKFPARNPS
jgi:hypothetical protein